MSCGVHSMIADEFNSVSLVINRGAKKQTAKNALGRSRTLVQSPVNVPFPKINIGLLD